MKKVYYEWKDIETMCVHIVNQMFRDNWMPDYIVGITRGGNVPATIISNMLDVRCEALKVSLRDGEPEQCESNCWMAEDAFGSIPYEDQQTFKSRWDVDKRKKILIVDDINDSGATYNWIKDDWMSSCMPNEQSWDTVWHRNVKFASLVENISSKFDSDYWCDECNKIEEPTWQVFPWEIVGKFEVND